MQSELQRVEFLYSFLQRTTSFLGSFSSPKDLCHSFTDDMLYTTWYVFFFFFFQQQWTGIWHSLNSHHAKRPESFFYCVYIRKARQVLWWKIHISNRGTQEENDKEADSERKSKRRTKKSRGRVDRDVQGQGHLLAQQMSRACCSLLSGAKWICDVFCISKMS